MKTKKIFRHIALAALAIAPVMFGACTDTWDDHYKQSNTVSGQGTLLSHIAATPELSEFNRVIETIGASHILSSAQKFTVFAPANMSSAEADAVIAMYNEDKEKGVKDENNRAYTQFLYNHVSMYAHPVSSMTENDTVKMMNLKYMNINASTSTTGTVNEIPFTNAIIGSNGVLYITSQTLPFLPNVREFTRMHSELDSISEFLASFDVYELNEYMSVPGEIIDGEQHYVDSVVDLTNDFLRQYARIEREDSVYTFVAPTNEIWKQLYDEYMPYYNYSNDVKLKDSLQLVNVQKAIISPRFFNTSKNFALNFHPEDSLVNTSYYKEQTHNPRSNVFYNPSQTIFAGLTKNVCSNGVVYVDDKNTIDDSRTIFRRIDQPATYSAYMEPTLNDGVRTQDATVMTYHKKNYTLVPDPEYPDDPEKVTVKEEILKSYPYVEIKTKNSNVEVESEMTFLVPGLMSNCYYNIYIVTVPSSMNHGENNPPSWFCVRSYEKNEKGTFGKEVKLYNPVKAYEDETLSEETRTIIGGRSNKDEYYVASAYELDTILVQSGLQLQYASAGLSGGASNATYKLQVKSIGQSKYAEDKFTRTLRINSFIFVPFKTKEEAEAAKFDTDLFNDILLQGTKN